MLSIEISIRESARPVKRVSISCIEILYPLISLILVSSVTCITSLLPIVIAPIVS